MPEKLLRRSAEAKAKAKGVSLEQVLAETYGVSAGGAPAPAAPTPSAEPVPAAVPAAEPVPAAVPAAEPAAAAPVAVSAAPVAGVSLEEAAASLGMPEKLLRRSAEAKAKALGVSLEQVLADMLGVAAPAPAAPAAPAPVDVPTAAAAPVPAEVPPVAAAPVVAGTIAAPADLVAEAPVPASEADEVDPWPALFKIEFFTAILSAVFLVLLALAGPAPLFEPASGAVDPSKAPWYLLWLQQLLAWLQPQVAAFYLPLLIIVGLFAAPFVDRASDRAGRRVGILVFGFFVLALVVLTIVGFASRTTGFGYPWIAS